MMTHTWTLRKLAVWRSDRAAREWGFTLTEVMVTLVILSVGLLGIASQSVSVIQANSLSDQMTRATVLAKDKMEELKRLGYAHDQLNDTTSSNNPPGVSTDPQTNPSFFTNPDHSDTNLTHTSAPGTVTLTSLKDSTRPTPNLVWNVANNTPANGMKTVTIIVGWKTNKSGSAAKAHYVALTTIIHEYM